MSKYEKLAKEFEELTGVEQWRWAIHHKGEITVYLEKNSTYFTFNNDIDHKVYGFDNFIEVSNGTQQFLEASGFMFEVI